MQSPPWSTATRGLVMGVILIAGIALFIFAFPLIQALSIAALLAFLLNPIVQLLMRRLRMKRSLAVALVYFVTLLVLASIPAILGTLAFTQLQHLSENFQTVLTEIRKWLTQPIIFFGFDLSPRNLIEQFGQSAGSTLTNITGNSLGIISGITTNFLWVLLVFVSLFYFLKDGPNIKPYLVKLAAPAYQSDMRKLLDELDQVWSLFMRVQLLIFIILGILFILGSSLVVWLYQLGLIPFSTFGLIAMLIIVYTLIQQVDNLWLRPQMLGNQLSLHPGVVFISLIGALALGGVLAAIVVVPLIASIKVIGHYTRMKLLGMPPWPEETPGEKG